VELVAVSMVMVVAVEQVVIEHRLEHQAVVALPNQHLAWLYQPTIRLLSVLVEHLVK
jgi:hypothetical protein